MAKCTKGKSCGAACVSAGFLCKKSVPSLSKLNKKLTEDQKWAKFDKEVEGAYLRNWKANPDGSLEELAKATASDLENSKVELMATGTDLYWAVASTGAQVREKNKPPEKEEPAGDIPEDLIREREKSIEYAKKNYGLTKSEAEAVAQYGFSLGSKDFGDTAISTNNRLRSGGELTAQDKDFVSALKKLPSNDSGKPHYRVESYSPEDPILTTLLNLKPGEVLEEKGFGSYSRSKSQAEEFRNLHGSVNVIYRTNSKDLRDISKIVRLEYEKENILPPGSKQRVKKVKLKSHTGEIEEYSSIEITLEGA